MALAQYSDVFWLPDGTLAAGVTARVFLHSTNVLAPLWTDATGTVPVANPGPTSAGGVLAFWAEEGEYWLHLDSESFEIAVGAAAQAASQQDIADAVAAEVVRADAAYDPAGAAAAAQAAAISAAAADATTKANAAQSAATSAAASDATAKVAAHEADTTAVHGIANTALLETQAGATAKVAAHVAAVDPHGDRAYADGKFLQTTVWRQRELPDPVTADGLYTGAAITPSTAQTTTPTAGYIKYAPAGVALAGSDVTGPFQFSGAGNFQIGTVAPDPSYVLPLSKYPNTYASGQSIWSVEFGTDTQIFQVRMKYISTATMIRLSIDGRKVTDLMQSSGGITPGSGHLITVDMGSATPRRIRIDFSTFPFGGVYLPPTATMWKVPLQGGRLMILGDSISDGSANNAGAGAGTWFARAARLLGSTDPWEQGRGGTGYITAGSYATFADRLAGDVVAWAPSRLIVWGGYNDSSGSQAAIGAAADSLYAAIKAGLPNAQVYVIGCWSPTGSPAASLTNTDATLRTSAAAAGFPFVSPLTGSVYNSAGALLSTHGGWITGTGRVGATTGSGNADTYIGTDAVHPTDAGHVYLARRVIGFIRETMPA